MRYIVDIESNGLLDEATEVHCATFIEVGQQKESDPRVLTLTGIHDIILEVKKVQESTTGLLIGHNIIGYDLELLRRLGNYKYTGSVVDTLVLSRLLYVDKRKSHSLASWGEQFGIVKPEHEDWSKLTDEMIHRNVQDCRINYELYWYFKERLGEQIP